ncbi:RNA polymerase sigma factor [Bacillus tianshenii]|uniref:RNA polymerase sigma factor n=1 Tax=Sutcliffiella tianshenii TaxID=1463404 RepID=UPI001CD544DD|nr:RNA polymerase sigma factor [Bacillus tianshenii]MCA1319322.1 RNA polymerase sigma factor [Bacillus tianshenii]
MRIIIFLCNFWKLHSTILLEKIKEGDRVNWEELYYEYSDRVYQFLMMMVGDEEIAEDLTHDTFLRVKNSLEKYRGDASHYTWIISIARHIVYDHWRKKRIIRFIPLAASKPVADYRTPDEILQKGEEIRELYEAMKKLKTNYQEVIILRKIQELSIEETSLALGWSVSKVKSTLLRALAALKNELIKRREGGSANEQTMA